MPVSIFHPSDRLAEFISYYYCVEETNSEYLISKKRIPDGTIELIFHFKHSFYKTERNGKRELINHKCLLQGQIQNYLEFQFAGSLGFIGVKFKPHGFYHFVNENINLFTNQIVDIKDIWGNEMNALEDKMAAAKSVAGRISLIEIFLSNRINMKSDKRIDFCVQFILNNKGIIKVDELTKSLNIGIRQLERKFLDTLGLSPFQFARIIKMQFALKDIESGAYPNLTQLSYRYEYYDQSHFIKEMNAFTGLSPKNIRTELCFSQIAYL